MEKLVSRDAMADAMKLNSQNPLVGILFRLSGIEKVNEFYSHHNNLEGSQFIEACLSELGISFEVDERDLKRIPKEGAFVTISNHPFGAIDGLSLLNIIQRIRPDFKVLGNVLLGDIKQLHESIIGVNPFDDQDELGTNYSSIRDVIDHVHNGNPIGVFPAGEVSAMKRDLKTITDATWNPQAIKLIKNLNVPVVPFYFEGQNSTLFQLLGVIHPSLRTLRLPAELMNKKGKVFKIRIGNPISSNDLKGFVDAAHLGRFLRAKTYAMGTSLEVERESFFSFDFPKKAVEIIPPRRPEVLKRELDEIPEALLFEQQKYQCYLAKSYQIPNLLKELARLREVTFRAVGEGTNKSMDLDSYDYYYNHLILWDKVNRKIVGAYRIGMGDEIMRRYGHKGFYTNSLFKMKAEFRAILPQAIELGRSFVALDYQKQRLPLFLLWKGILTVAVKEPKYRYFLGPVTISGNYKGTSKTLMIEFIRQNYFHKELTQFVRPRKEFIVNNELFDHEALVNATEKDLKKLDKLIEEIEPSSFKLPVLLKKYLHQNAKILGFNLDPKFNNALDGLMLLDKFDLPEHTIENLQKELNVS